MSKDTTNTAEVAATKAPTKMDRCRAIFVELHAPGFVLPEGEKSIRTLFMKRVVAEADMTVKAAPTYWTGLVSESKGGKLYPHPAKRKGKTETPEAPAGQPEPASETSDEEAGSLAHLEA